MRCNVIWLLVLLMTGGVSAGDASLRVTPVVKAVQEASPAVVNISTEKVVTVSDFNPFGHGWVNNFFQPMNRRNITRTSLGSGVIIRPDGIILTNEHIILPASKITVTLGDGMEYEADLIGASRRLDLALLKINDKNPLPFIPPGYSNDLMIGETVIAIGNPFGLSSTVTTGVISALNRTISFKDQESGQTHTYFNFIQTDTSINPGNSGGPLLNILGELVGINTAIYAEAQGIGFAIPIDKAKRVLDDLLEKGDVPRIWLGVHVQELTQALAQHLRIQSEQGVLISEIRTDSPGEAAGLQSGDVITKMDGQSILSPAEYRERLREYTPGNQILMHVLRGEKELDIPVTAQELPLARRKELAWDLVGLQVRDLTSSDISSGRLMVDKGVMVTNVRTGSPAENVGIKAGDVLLQLDRDNITNEQQFLEGIKNAVNQDSIMLVVIRRTNAYRVSLELE